MLLYRYFPIISMNLQENQQAYEYTSIDEMIDTQYGYIRYIDFLEHEAKRINAKGYFCIITEHRNKVALFIIKELI